MKLIKIRFTAWRDGGPARRTPALQRQLDYWSTRVGVLSHEAADLEVQRAREDTVGLQKSLARISADLQNLEAQRALLLYAEAAERNVANGEARKHKRVGTFGYQILDDSGTRVIRVVDEGGNDLPEKAVFSYELMDDDPPLPASMKDGRAPESYVRK